MGAIVAGDKVLMEFSTLGDRYVSVVTNVHEDGTLFIYSPVPLGVLKRLESDKNVFIRFACEGVLRGFRSKVINDNFSSHTILELTPAIEVFDAEDRSEPRCNCRFPAKVYYNGKDAVAVVEDVSASCSRVRLINGDLDFGERAVEALVRLTFHPFEVDEGYSVDCRVVNTFIKNTQTYMVLAFQSDKKGEREKIARFVEAQLGCGLPRI